MGGGKRQFEILKTKYLTVEWQVYINFVKMINDLKDIEVANVPILLDIIQQSSACHLKYSHLFKKAVESQNGEKSLEELFKCLQYAFLTNYREKNIYLERIIAFTTMFAVSFKSTSDDTIVQIHPVLHSIIQFVLKLSNSANDGHRFWSCKLLNKIFQELEELSDELYEEIKESMLDRLQDPKSVIRCQAVLTLHRLQDPADREDPILAHFCSMIDLDFNAKVRQMCLEKIGLNKHVVKTVLNRIRDVDANVRLAAFQKLKAIAKYLKLEEKRLILQCGFNDSSEKIRNFTSSVLIQSWLEHYENDFIKLMKSIRLDACYEDIIITTHFDELILRALFKSCSVDDIRKYINVNEEKLIKYEDLNWETVLYYRIAVQYLRQCEGFEDALDAILPELIYLCRHIKGYCEYVKNKEDFDELEYHFILQQLFTVTKGCDVSDTASRQCLNSLVHHMLQNEKNLTPDVNEVILSNLEKTIPNVNDRTVFVCEIISNIVYGDDGVDYEAMESKEREKKLAVSQLQADIISLHDQEKHYVFVEKNYSEAERCKLEIEEKESALQSLREIEEKPEEIEKKTDMATTLRSLSIAEALLRSPTIKQFNPAIATLNSEIISPALIYDDEAVKERALKCYALCCIIDLRSARYGIHLFSGLVFAAGLDNIEILITSLKTVVDLLTIYGLSLVEKPDEDGENARRDSSDSTCEEVKKVFVGGTSLTDLLQGLASHLGHENLQVQEIATKGICILLLHSRITSPSLLSLIIIKWANPATEDDRLKQFIGIALNELTKLPNCYTYFGDAVLSTIRTLAKAPRNSALKDINIDNLIKFMVTLSQMPIKGGEIHAEIALKICTQMREKPRLKVNMYFSKVLPLLNIPENEVDELVTICDELRDVIRDNQIRKNINKFNTNLTKNNVNKMVQIQEEDGAID